MMKSKAVSILLFFSTLALAQPSIVCQNQTYVWRLKQKNQTYFLASTSPDSEESVALDHLDCHLSPAVPAASCQSPDGGKVVFEHTRETKTTLDKDGQVQVTTSGRVDLYFRKAGERFGHSDAFTEKDCTIR
jgi:hypothetical protein